ncbi:hypothetical protein D3C77_422980 [compost metagenome]
MLETPDEFTNGQGQRLFRVGTDKPSGINDREKHIPQLKRLLILCFALLNRCFKLGQLLLDFSPYSGNILPIESGFGRLLLDFISLHQGRQITRHTAKRGLLLRLDALAALFLCLHSLPVAQRRLRVFGTKLSKDMRMAINQLLIQGLNNIIGGKGSRLLLHLRMKHYLKEQVPKLLTHMIRIVIINRFQYLVRLFNEIFADGLMSLLPIPRTAFRASKNRDDFMQPLEASVA